MRNRGVGQQSLGVRLRESREVGAGHGGDRDEHNYGGVNGAQRPQSKHQYAQQQGPSRSFHRHRHESGNAGGRAFISVRRPLMKRNGGDLKQQSHHGRQQRDHYHRIVRIQPRHCARNDRQIGAAGNSVKQ